MRKSQVLKRLTPYQAQPYPQIAQRGNYLAMLKWLSVTGIAFLFSLHAAWADPLLIEGDMSCFKKPHSPDSTRVAIDRTTGALFLQGPCGWQFFRVLPKEEIEVALKLSNAAPVPTYILSLTIDKLNQIRVAGEQKRNG
jgi:hypothetical protein